MNVEIRVKRNLRGYLGDFHPAEAFLDQYKSKQKTSRDISVSEKELIEEALSAREQPKQNIKEECHYVLLLTKNNAALCILQMMAGPVDIEIIFGSSFLKDQEYSQIFANMNRIKICMETGK